MRTTMAAGWSRVAGMHSHAWRQGLTLPHFSAQPEPFLVSEATTSVHISAQPETFAPIRPHNIAHQKLSSQAETVDVCSPRKVLTLS